MRRTYGQIGKTITKDSSKESFVKDFKNSIGTLKNANIETVIRFFSSIYGTIEYIEENTQISRGELQKIVDENELKDNEVLEVIKQSISFAYFKDYPQYVEQELRNMIGKYPENSVLRTQLASNLLKQKKYEKSKNEIILALAYSKDLIKVPTGDISYTLSEAIDIDVEYVSHLIGTDNFRKAKDYINEVSEEGRYEDVPEFNNILVQMNVLVDQSESFSNKIKKAEGQFENKLGQLQARSIEIITIFSAVIAIFVGSVQIIINYTYDEAKSLLLLLGLILLIFSSLVGFIFRQGKEKIILGLILLALLTAITLIAL